MSKVNYIDIEKKHPIFGWIEYDSYTRIGEDYVANDNEGSISAKNMKQFLLDNFSDKNLYKVEIS